MPRIMLNPTIASRFDNRLDINGDASNRSAKLRVSASDDGESVAIGDYDGSNVRMQDCTYKRKDDWIVDIERIAMGDSLCVFRIVKR